MDAILSCQGLTKLYGQKAALVDLPTISKGTDRRPPGAERQWKNDAVKACSRVAHCHAGKHPRLWSGTGDGDKKRVSFLPERSCLPAGMRVREALEFFGDFYADFQLDKAAEMLKDLQIQPNDKLNALSKGTREKLQLALVMSRKAELYLLDEPIGGVDPAARDYILNTIIRNYNEDATMILSTHLIHDIEAVFDDVVMIGGGHIVLAGSVDAIREERDKSIDTIFREVFRCWGN